MKLLERYGCSQTSRLAAWLSVPGLLLLLLQRRQLAPVRSIARGEPARCRRQPTWKWSPKSIAGNFSCELGYFGV